jgi:hypothetical protein
MVFISYFVFIYAVFQESFTKIIKGKTKGILLKITACNLSHIGLLTNSTNLFIVCFFNIFYQLVFIQFKQINKF